MVLEDNPNIYYSCHTYEHLHIFQKQKNKEKPMWMHTESSAISIRIQNAKCIQAISVRLCHYKSAKGSHSLALFKTEAYVYTFHKAYLITENQANVP